MEYNIAFSSSGVRFAAHIGVLAYLQDNNIDIKNFAGTSGGAIVACWGANNLPARDLMDLTLQFGYPKYFIRPSLKVGGFLDPTFFGETIARYCNPKNNLWIVTFNILKMQKQIWTGTKFILSKVLNATTCIPGLFKPVIFSNGLHVDGIFGSFCPDDLWDSGITLSIRLQSSYKNKSRYPFDSFVHKIEKTAIDFLDSFQRKDRDSTNCCSTDLVYIQPDVSSIAQTDLFLVKTEDHIELFKKGYEAANEVFSHKKTPLGI